MTHACANSQQELSAGARDRLLRRAGVDVIHITNFELAKHKARALVELLPRQFFGLDWNYEGEQPVPFLKFSQNLRRPFALARLAKFDPHPFHHLAKEDPLG
jgi:hypothetical protein